MSERVVVLCQNVERELATAMSQAMPNEVAGLLGGRVEANTFTVDCFVPIAGAICGRDHFEIPAADFARLEAQLRAGGRQWLGFAHSHPTGTTSLSGRDRTQLWRGCLQIVIGASRLPDLVLEAYWLDGDCCTPLHVARHAVEAAS